MVSRMDYVHAALDAIATVLPNDPPIRILLREILFVLCLAWADDRDPSVTDMRHLRTALEKAVAAA